MYIIQTHETLDISVGTGNRHDGRQRTVTFGSPAVVKTTTPGSEVQP